MSDLNNTVTAAGFPRVQGPTFLFSSTLNAYLAQSMDEAASRGELTRFLTVPMIGAGMAPAGVAVIGSPFIMAAPHLNAVATTTLIPAANGVINSHYGQIAQRLATKYNGLPVGGEIRNYLNGMYEDYTKVKISDIPEANFPH